MTSQYGPGCRTLGFFNVPARFCDFCEFSSLIVLVILVRMARSGRAYLNPILVLARIRHILSRIALVLRTHWQPCEWLFGFIRSVVSDTRCENEADFLTPRALSSTRRTRPNSIPSRITGNRHEINRIARPARSSRKVSIFTH